MTETNIPPIEEAWELADGLTSVIEKYIKYATADKNESERINDWAHYHNCIGRIDAYGAVLLIIKDMNIKRT